MDAVWSPTATALGMGFPTLWDHIAVPGRRHKFKNVTNIPTNYKATHARTHAHRHTHTHTPQPSCTVVPNMRHARWEKRRGCILPLSASGPRRQAASDAGRSFSQNARRPCQHPPPPAARCRNQQVPALS